MLFIFVYAGRILLREIGGCNKTSNSDCIIPFPLEPRAGWYTRATSSNLQSSDIIVSSAYGICYERFVRRGIPSILRAFVICHGIISLKDSVALRRWWSFKLWCNIFCCEVAQHQNGSNSVLTFFAPILQGFRIVQETRNARQSKRQ